MRIAHYTLLAGVMLGLLGFVAAVALEKRQLGMAIFLLGFFVGAASAVFIVLTSAGGGFGKLGTAIKLTASGFGLIVLGQSVGFLLGKDGVIGNVLFFVGMAVMMVGIVIATLRMIKN